MLISTLTSAYKTYPGSAKETSQSVSNRRQGLDKFAADIGCT